MRQVAFVGMAAGVQVTAWLLVRPDLAGAHWEGGRTASWLALEAVAALAIGALALSRQAVVRAVGAGWLLQMVHFAVAGAHYDDTLWGVGLLVQALLGAAALGVATLLFRGRRGWRAQRRA